MKLLNKYKYQLGIFLVTIFIFIVNFSGGKFLCGWDSLQTELNPWLAVTRAFAASWQEYQSFGLPAGMAHAADLVRALFIWIFSFVLPQEISRYFFHILMLLVGGLGAFTLFEKIFKNKGAAFLGGLFYMLNLGTIQMFYVPFEPFSILFAGLPWEIYYFLQYISPSGHLDPAVAGERSRPKAALFKLFLVNVIFTPQAYLQTLFVVYILILALISIPLIKNWKRILIAFFTIFIVNSFWIFPQIYFLKTDKNVVSEAKMNQIATENTYYQNKEKGTIDNFLRLEGFYFDLSKSDSQLLFTPWKEHFTKPFVKYLPYIFAAIFLLGIFYKSKYRNSFLLGFGICGFALLNDTQPFAFINETLRQNSFINQIFRSPFTKFIVPYSLIASYFFVGGILVILEATKWLIESLHFNTATLSPHTRQTWLRSWVTKYISGVLGFLIFGALILYSLPVFTGNLFSQSMKINIPTDYLNTIKYFQTVDKNQRIALLPEYTFWGWFYTNWGYNGSGFLWYGIEQPIVSRTFDVWSKPSESYFWELKTAIENDNEYLIGKVFSKYSINYLILDKSLFPVSASLKGMQIDRLQELLKKMSSVVVIKEGSDLIVYKIDNVINNFLYTTSSLPIIGPEAPLTNQDVAFTNNNNYIVKGDKKPDIYYPFLDLFSQANISQKKWDLKEQEGYFFLRATLDFDPSSYLLSEGLTKTKALIYDKDQTIEYQNNYQILIYENNLIIKIPKTLIKNYSSIDYREEKCSSDKKTTCFGFDAPYIDEKYSYLLTVHNKNISGRRLFFYVLDKTKNQSYIEDRLTSDNAMYILPQKYKYGVGYSFSFQNNSYDNLKSQNIVSGIDLYLFPYEAIKNISLLRPDYYPKTQVSDTSIISQKNSYFWYDVELKNNTQKYLVLNQAFNSGWVAIFSYNNLEHFKISNWSNGFNIDGIKNGKIVLFYWPQLLEFLGLFLLLVYLIFIKYENRHRSKSSPE